MSQFFGETHDLKGSLRIAIRPTLFLLAMMIPIAVGFWVLLPTLVDFALPNYAPGKDAARWGLVIVAMQSFQPINNLFSVGKRQGLYLIAILTGISVYGLALFLITRQGFYLAAFPQALSIGRGVFSLVCITMVFRIVKKV